MNKHIIAWEIKKRKEDMTLNSEYICKKHIKPKGNRGKASHKESLQFKGDICII